MTERTSEWVYRNAGREGPATAAPPPAKSPMIDLTSEASSSPLSIRSYGPAPAVFKNAPPLLPSKQTNGASARSGMFTSSSTVSGAFASSSASFLNVKNRMANEMRSHAQTAGIPIGVPFNPPFQRARTSAALSPQDTEEEDKEVLEALAGMNISNNLTAADQEAELKKLLEAAVDMEDVDVSEGAPEGLTAKLRPYQMQGLHWLKNREKGGKKMGGILADDMGLGKTVQMISLMLANPPTGKPKTTLIVCPLSLMSQWQSEIEKHSDADLRILQHHGPNRPKDGRKLLKYDVVIVSYATCASEWVDPKPKKAKEGKKVPGSNDLEVEDNDEAYVAPSMRTAGALFSAGEEPNKGFYRIILDEGHTIKNRLSRQHKACCALVGKLKWILTGTPVQNEIMDIFSLFEFLGRSVAPLNQLTEFKSKIADPLKAGRSKVAMARLAVVLKAVMMRRTKDLLIDGKPILALPARIVIEVKGPFLDAAEREFYTAVENKMQLKLNAFLKAGTAMSNYTDILTLLLRMRQACSHPSLALSPDVDKDALEGVVDPAPRPVKSNSSGTLQCYTPWSPAENNDVDALAGAFGALGVVTKTCALCTAELEKGEADVYCESCQQELQRYGDLTFSTKIRRMMNVLQSIRTEDPQKKTIVFSQFTSMFDLIEPFLKKGGFKFVRFDGKTNAAMRAIVLDQIANDQRTTIILISIKSGSVGLNLTCCSRVILLDLWNPQIENQAFDRAHRMGQKEDVKIYKITVDKTIEDRILMLQKTKAELAQACLDGGTIQKNNKLSMDDILYLFRGNGEPSA